MVEFSDLEVSCISEASAGGHAAYEYDHVFGIRASALVKAE